MNDSPKDFFISYNSADVFWGKWIAWQLEEAGFTTIIQAWDFLAGQDFVLGMQEAVKARHTIAVLSEDYLKADFTQPEWSAAFVRDPRGEKRILIPVLVRPCKREGFFATRIYIDFIDVEEDVALQRLLAGISPNRAKPDTAPAFPGKTSSSGNKGKANRSALAESSSPHSEIAIFPKNMPPVTKSIKIFSIYTQKDKHLLMHIEEQLTILKQQGLITTWNSGQILPGREKAREIETHWSASQVILLLISANSLAASYDMMISAIDRHTAGTAHVIPILLRPVDLKGSPFAKLEILPDPEKSVISWDIREEAFAKIAQGIRQVVEKLLLTD